MTAEPAGHVMWSPDPVRQQLGAYPLDMELRVRDVAP